MRKPFSIVAAFLLLVLCAETVLASHPVSLNVHRSSVDRLDATPDLMQSRPEWKLPADEMTYCGPVAVSNSMIWLSKNG